jgi:hypothetical protein
MHTKINKHPNDSNFPTKGLWSKTNLGMQHMHLELPLILSYLFTKKIKHTSKINTSDNYKIVINSEVGHKNIIIFSYKNHLDGFCINTKQFL